MKEFPSFLVPANSGQFASLRRQRLLSYMRRELYELVLSENKEDFFNLDGFSDRFALQAEETLTLAKTLATELEQLGWTVNFSYADTALFVYTGERPLRCFEQ